MKRKFVIALILALALALICCGTAMADREAELAVPAEVQETAMEIGQSYTYSIDVQGDPNDYTYTWCWYIERDENRRTIVDTSMPIQSSSHASATELTR